MLTRKPQKGDVVVWRDRTGAVTSRGTVSRAEGRLAWCTWDSGPADPFIWEFSDGLNQLAEFESPMTVSAGCVAKDGEASLFDDLGISSRVVRTVNERKPSINVAR